MKYLYILPYIFALALGIESVDASTLLARETQQNELYYMSITTPGGICANPCPPITPILP